MDKNTSKDFFASRILVTSSVLYFSSGLTKVIWRIEHKEIQREEEKCEACGYKAKGLMGLMCHLRAGVDKQLRRIENEQDFEDKPICIDAYVETENENEIQENCPYGIKTCKFPRDGNRCLFCTYTNGETETQRKRKKKQKEIYRKKKFYKDTNKKIFLNHGRLDLIKCKKEDCNFPDEDKQWCTDCMENYGNITKYKENKTNKEEKKKRDNTNRTEERKAERKTKKEEYKQKEMEKHMNLTKWVKKKQEDNSTKKRKREEEIKEEEGRKIEKKRKIEEAKNYKRKREKEVETANKKRKKQEDDVGGVVAEGGADKRVKSVTSGVADATYTGYQGRLR